MICPPVEGNSLPCQANQPGLCSVWDQFLERRILPTAWIILGQHDAGPTKDGHNLNLRT